jgi:hypothetical protein
MLVTVPSRLAAALTVAVASTALVTGCASPAAPLPAAAVTSGFSAMGLAFRYPGTWHSGTWNDDLSSFSGMIVSLSTGRQHDPCQRSVKPTVTSVSCGDPVAKLPPGGVLVEWTDHGFPGWHAPRANTRIGGRPATETVTGGDWCQALGGTRTITVVIPGDVKWNWNQMDACLRGPGIASEQAEISAMLKSVRFAPRS